MTLRASIVYNIAYTRVFYFSLYVMFMSLWVDTKRIVRSGFVSFWRNSFVSLAAIIVMIITLFVVGALIFVNAMLSAALTSIQEKVDINVYFTTDAEESDIFAIRRQIETLPEVAKVTYISRDEALVRFRARHADDQLTLQALAELGENPLGASLVVRAKEPSQYEGIAQFLSEEQNALSADGRSIIDTINYFQNRDAINTLASIITSAEKFGLFVTVILIIASILITFTTIRLAIYTARDEITVMRLVGASNAYIRGPFVFEGVLYGCIAGIITMILFYPIALTAGPRTRAFFGDIDMFAYYTQNFGILFLILVGSGMLLGAVSSYLAVKRYLRV